MSTGNSNSNDMRNPIPPIQEADQADRGTVKARDGEGRGEEMRTAHTTTSGDDIRGLCRSGTKALPIRSCSVPQTHDTTYMRAPHGATRRRWVRVRKQPLLETLACTKHTHHFCTHNVRLYMHTHTHTRWHIHLQYRSKVCVCALLRVGHWKYFFM